MSRRMMLVVNQAAGSPARIRLAEELVEIGDAEEEEVQVDFAGLAGPIASFSASPPVPGAVGSFGKSLFDWLALHQVIARQLTAAQQNGCLLTVDDRAPSAQSLPWEAMQDGLGNFVALRSSPLFSRIYVPRRSPKEVERTFRPPLRVLAVIAAAGAQGDGSVLSGLPELEALLAGLSGGGAGFALRVLGADDDVRARVEALADPRVTFKELAGFATLEQELAAGKPDVLHFFCHGFAGDEATPPHLELATRTDQLAKKERGSILLAGDDLVPLLEEQPQLWMVVLNSCLGAAASESASLARELIGGADLPAVVAMREAVERRDAHLFAEELMREVQKVVAGIVAEKAPRTLEWASVLPAVRARLVRERGGSLAKAKDLREWTLPVLYVHRDDFRIGKVLSETLAPEVETESAKLSGQIEKLQALRGEMATLLPADKLQELDAHLATLRAELAELEGKGPAAQPAQPAPEPALPVPPPAPQPAAEAAKRLELAANAWTGGLGEATPVSAGWTGWALREQAGRAGSAKLALAEIDLAARFDWRNPAVGWGVVLPHRPGVDLAGFADAPEPIQKLIAERRKVLGRVPVFRYVKDASLAHSLVLLQDFAAGSSLTIDATPTGVAQGSIPQYLLLCGSPAEIPWDLQYVLATVRFVGRLDLDAAGLERYVAHLLSGWDGSAARRDRSLTWTVYHGKKDITSTLRAELTKPFHDRLADPARLGAGAVWLDGRETASTREQLAARLAEHRPAFIASSSHGATWPLDDTEKMGRDLGLLVDQNEDLLDPAALLAGWQPDGAVWLAHACCSAGAKARSDYEGLFDPDGKTGKLLAAVAKVGDVTAPLPRALLGAEKPLRAFIGQVEPTFDWTVLQPETKQTLTSRLIEPFQDRLLGGRPAGSLLEAWHQRAAALNQAWFQMKQSLDNGAPVEPSILYPRLAAADVASTVLLGDPTAVVG